MCYSKNSENISFPRLNKKEIIIYVVSVYT